MACQPCNQQESWCNLALELSPIRAQPYDEHEWYKIPCKGTLNMDINELAGPNIDLLP